MAIPRTETPNSSNMQWFEFSNGILTIQFNSGRYEHHSVPEDEAQKMLRVIEAGGSIGSFYHRSVKGKYQTKKIA